MTLCPGLPGRAGTRKVESIWILLKRETVSGSGISWAVCKSASRSRLSYISQLLLVLRQNPRSHALAEVLDFLAVFCRACCFCISHVNIGFICTLNMCLQCFDTVGWASGRTFGL